MKALNLITLVLVIVGGLNWGLVGAFDFNLVAALFGDGSALSRIVYILVGLSALWQLVPLFRGAQVGETRAQAMRLAMEDARPRRSRRGRGDQASAARQSASRSQCTKFTITPCACSTAASWRWRASKCACWRYARSRLASEAQSVSGA